MDRSDYMSCPRECGVDVREHNSSDLIDGRCDTGTDLPLLDIGGYLACGCDGSQREHTCQPND
ncbi:hypothetical protein GAR06_06223 [Micromonospora saelicesensis]|uniref:hypothetical protein n=1 Tax=Micromonospora saelicesensis TaxID=285676 RepID=UPI000DC4D253|nr:hypothetical protein [Micromonospora saelicesensis]RAO40477.1 hypothetical protein GAR06_06223 [Micromonospora saelicesensis]